MLDPLPPGRSLVARPGQCWGPKRLHKQPADPCLRKLNTNSSSPGFNGRVGPRSPTTHPQHLTLADFFTVSALLSLLEVLAALGEFRPLERMSSLMGEVRPSGLAGCFFRPLRSVDIEPRLRRVLMLCFPLSPSSSSLTGLNINGGGSTGFSMGGSSPYFLKWMRQSVQSRMFSRPPWCQSLEVVVKQWRQAYPFSSCSLSSLSKSSSLAELRSKNSLEGGLEGVLTGVDAVRVLILLNTACLRCLRWARELAASGVFFQ